MGTFVRLLWTPFNIWLHKFSSLRCLGAYCGPRWNTYYVLIWQALKIVSCIKISMKNHNRKSFPAQFTQYNIYLGKWKSVSIFGTMLFISMEKKVIAKQFTKGLLQSEFLKTRSILHKTQTLAQLVLSISEIFLLVSIFFRMIHELFSKNG